jgi:hypothetical protein
MEQVYSFILVQTGNVRDSEAPVYGGWISESKPDPEPSTIFNYELLIIDTLIPHKTIRHKNA